MWHQTEVTRRLGMRVPIIQGPFGGGMSSVELAAAVSGAGGLGSFGAHHMRGDQIVATARAIRHQTDGPFALNLWIPYEDSEDPQVSEEAFQANVELLKPYYEELGIDIPVRPNRYAPAYDEQIEALLEARPPVFSFVYGIPADSVLEKCRSLGITTIGAATTTEEAVALDGAGVDMVVASGFEAGGHRVSFLSRPEDCLTGSMALVPQVVDAVSCPVIAAGGIADGRGVAAALTLGASAVQVGTAFLACEESAASPVQRDALFAPDAVRTDLTKAFTGRLARGIRNRFMEDLRSHQDRLPQYPVQGWFTAPIKSAAAEQGRAELMSLWAGQGAPLVRNRSAVSLVAELEKDAGELLSRG